MATSKLLEAAEEATAIARMQQPAARVTWLGHAYVPEGSERARILELLRSDEMLELVANVIPEPEIGNPFHETAEVVLSAIAGKIDKP